MSTKATTENFIRQSIPFMLTHLRLTFEVVQVIRDCSSQKHRVENCHIHRDILNAAYETLRFKQNYRKVVEKGKMFTLNNYYMPQMLNCILYHIYAENGSIFYYVNASKFQYIQGSGANEVTLDRIRKSRHDPTRILSMKQCIQIYMSMHEIREKKYSNSEELYYECDCRCYWYSAVICSHILVVYHLLGTININHLVSRIAPKKKAGRPTKRSKALEKNEAIDAKGMKLADWVKTMIRHPDYLTGYVTDYRLKPNGIFVWSVNFPDARGGAQMYEMEKNDLQCAIEAYKAHEKKSATNFEIL